MLLSHWPQQRRDSTPDSFSAECICRTRVNFHFPIQCPIQHTMSLSLSHETTSKESLARQNAFAQKPTGSTFTLTANVKVRRFLAKNLIAKEFYEKTLKQRQRIWSAVLNSNFCRFFFQTTFQPCIAPIWRLGEFALKRSWCFFLKHQPCRIQFVWQGKFWIGQDLVRARPPTKNHKNCVASAEQGRPTVPNQMIFSSRKRAYILKVRVSRVQTNFYTFRMYEKLSWKNTRNTPN